MSDTLKKRCDAEKNRCDTLEKRCWTVFVVPLAVYMLVGALEPSPDGPGGKMLGLAIPYSAYPLVYTLKIALTLAAMAFALPGYRQFRRPPGMLAVLVGAVGIVVWVGLWKLTSVPALDAIVTKIPGYAPRPGYDPLNELAATPAWAWTFLGIRFFGLVIVVPVIEEFFLRGFVMRIVMDADWWKVPLCEANWTAIAASVAYGVLAHPSEFLAAAAWFGMVTWLMLRTRNIWACVAAHAVTNLLLGIYVVVWHQWPLW